jgi:hypothetical protein
VDLVCSVRGSVLSLSTLERQRQIAQQPAVSVRVLSPACHFPSQLKLPGLIFRNWSWLPAQLLKNPTTFPGRTIFKPSPLPPTLIDNLKQRPAVAFPSRPRFDGKPRRLQPDVFCNFPATILLQTSISCAPGCASRLARNQRTPALVFRRPVNSSSPHRFLPTPAPKPSQPRLSHTYLCSAPVRSPFPILRFFHSFAP